jgi:DNA repair protein RecO (recombination protein O)
MKSFKTEGVVLKRINYGEADRIVTIFTKDFGKITAIAKGVRRLTSKKKSSLEPGTRAAFFFITGKNLHLLTQTDLIDSHQKLRQTLNGITKVNQMLEIVDLLLADQQEAASTYQILVNTLARFKIDGNHKQIILTNTQLILKELGYTHDKAFSEHGLKNYIEELAGRPLRTKAYLTTGV